MHLVGGCFETRHTPWPQVLHQVEWEAVQLTRAHRPSNEPSGRICTYYFCKCWQVSSEPVTSQTKMSPHNFITAFKFIFNQKWYHSAGPTGYGTWFLENAKQPPKTTISSYSVYPKGYAMGSEVYCKIGGSKMFCPRLGSITALKGTILFTMGKFLRIVKIMTSRIYIKFPDRHISA